MRDTPAVICGAGVIGAATAYFLAKRGEPVVLIERGDVACAASGKSGGFLARDWCDGSPLEALARTSFDLHAALAPVLQAESGVDYGYRPVDTLLVDESTVAQGARPGAHSAWLDGSGTIRGAIGTTATTAQVQPARFTHALVEAAKRLGATVRRGEVKGVAIRGSDSRAAIHGVLVDGETVPTDRVVLAMGPWTGRFAGELPIPPVAGLRGNSIILRPDTPLPAECLFVETNAPGVGAISPEIYPRPDGEVYVCGMADDLPFPADPMEILPNDDACNVLAAVAGRLSSALAQTPIVKRQACFRPITHDGLPVLGPVPGIAGCYVATAHNCWGILNAPASGQAMAELIATGTSQAVSLAPFRADRFDDARRVPIGHRA